jgi:hypothetical protein
VIREGIQGRIDKRVKGEQDEAQHQEVPVKPDSRQPNVMNIDPQHMMPGYFTDITVSVFFSVKFECIIKQYMCPCFSTLLTDIPQKCKRLFQKCFSLSVQHYATFRLRSKIRHMHILMGHIPPYRS